MGGHILEQVLIVMIPKPQAGRAHLILHQPGPCHLDQFLMVHLSPVGHAIGKQEHPPEQIGLRLAQLCPRILPAPAQVSHPLHIHPSDLFNRLALRFYFAQRDHHLAIVIKSNQGK